MKHTPIGHVQGDVDRSLPGEPRERPDDERSARTGRPPVTVRGILAELLRRADAAKLGERFEGGNMDDASVYNAFMFAARQVSDITGVAIPADPFPDRLSPTFDAAGENPPGFVAKRRT